MRRVRWRDTSAIDERNPLRCASAMTESIPTPSASCTATGFRERVSASRIVISPRNALSEFSGLYTRLLSRRILSAVSCTIEFAVSTFAERRGIHERLEGRSGLTISIDGTVERTAGVVAAANKCTYLHQWPDQARPPRLPDNSHRHAAGRFRCSEPWPNPPLPSAAPPAHARAFESRLHFDIAHTVGHRRLRRLLQREHRSWSRCGSPPCMTR